MLFTAYDKVHFEQYGLYQEYAELEPGEDSYRVAREIFGVSPKDDVVRVLAEQMNARKLALRIVIEEFFLYVIRDASGEAFDVYLVDEDNLFLGVATNIAEEDVVRTGERLMVKEHLKSFEGETSYDSGVEGFERINGYMTIWGSPVRVDVISVSWKGTETVETVLTNGRCNRLFFRDGSWAIHGGKGAYIVTCAPSKTLRFYVDGKPVVDITSDMSEQFTHVK